MKKESKNWVIIPKRSVIRYGKIARRQREDYKLDRNSAALIKCEECDTSVKDNEEEYKKMNHFFKKGSSRKRRE